VLDPARLREDLAELALGLRDDAAAFGIEDDAARARGALVEGEQVGHGKSLRSRFV
jgi:hypothetical protein